MIIALPNQLEQRTVSELRREGFATTTIRRNGQSLNVVAYYMPPRANVVELPKRSVVSAIFDFARRPQ